MKMPFTNKIKDVFSFPKLYSIFLHHFWFWRRRFLKEILFWHILAHCVPCVHFMKLLCTKFVGTNPSYMCEKIKLLCVVVFEKKRFEAIVDGNTYAYERPRHKDRRRNASVLKILQILI
jgi:hypothetical protein